MASNVSSAGRHYPIQTEHGVYWCHISVRGGFHEYTPQVIETTINNWALVADAIRDNSGASEAPESTPETQVAEFYKLNKEQRETMFAIPNHVTVWGAKWSKWAHEGAITAMDNQETSFTLHSDSNPNELVRMLRALIDVTDMANLVTYQDDEQPYYDDENQETEPIQNQQPQESGNALSYPIGKDERDELEKQLLLQSGNATFRIGKLYRDGNAIKCYPAMGQSAYTKYPGKMSIGNIDWISDEKLKSWLLDNLPADKSEYDILAKHNGFWYADVSLKQNNAGTVYWNITAIRTK